MKIAFVYNQKPEKFEPDSKDAEMYAEFDPPETIDGIRAAIEANGYEVIMIEANEEAYDRLRRLRGDIDLVFNFAEAVTNTEDREAQVPMFCEILRIPYSGPKPLSAAIILDKARTKEIWAFHGVPTAPFQMFWSQEEKLTTDLGWPVIVKPNSEGSSQGVRNNSLVKNQKELEERVAEVGQQFGYPVMAEKFLSGREFTVSVIGNGEDLEILPIMEFYYGDLAPGVNKIDSYEAKWVWNNPANVIEQKSICPAKIDKKFEEELGKISKKAFLTVGCRDWGRVDIRCDEKGIPFALEINCPVGLQPNPKVHSCMPISARAAGMSFEELIGKIIKTALKRYGKA